MYLQELTINGFKSFADKTQIKFDPGLTGVVGPNGSGKSNITEAIRWVLGEQSAKSLRGERMGDVIFAGTDTRPPLNRAEVTMVFNNDDGYLDQQPTQVSVTRRLFRNGDSEFLLNNKQVRLKDIVTLFMDSGLGRDSFAFISQGRVEAIFNSKPENRRGIFEEAAGVLKYKQQKAKAQAQLDETDDNLDRVHDIVHELSVRLEPLAEQSSMAREYQRQSAEYATLHQQLLARQVHDMVGQQQATERAAHATKQRIEELNGKIAGLEAESDRRTQAATALDQQLAQVNDELLAKSMKQQSLNGEENVSSERVQNAASTLADLRDRLERAEHDRDDAHAHLATIKAERSELTNTIKDLRTQIRAAEQQASTPAQLNEQLETAQQEYIDTLQQQANNRNAVSALSKEAQLADSQQAATRSRLAEIQAQLDKLTAQQKDVQQQIDAAQKAQDEATTKVRDAEAAVNQGQAEYQQLNQQLMDHSRAYTQANARYKTLKELNDDYAGFYSGVRTVLKNKDGLPGVVGAVAELLKIPERYQVAFDQAIGGSLQAIVTADQTAAKRAISFLKQRRAGRATFLPADIIRPRELPQSIRQQLTGQKGFIGVGIDLVGFDQGLANVMGSLIGTLVVVDNLDNAVPIANSLHHRYRLVTLDGDILNAGGSMSGGAQHKGSTSPLARNQEAQRLSTQLGAMTAKLDQERAELAQLEERITAANSTLREYSNRLTELRDQTHTTRSSGQLVAQQIGQLEQQAAALKVNLPQGEDDMEQRQADLTKQGEAIQQKLDNLQRNMTDLRDALADQSNQAADHQERLTQLRTDLAVKQEAAKTATAQIDQWQESETAAVDQRNQLAQRIATIEKTATETAQEKEERSATLAQLGQDIAALQAQQERLNADKATARTELSRVSASITTAYTERQEVMATSETQSVQLNRLKMNLDAALTTLSEEYQTSYEAAIAAVPDDAVPIPELQSQIKLLKRGLDELGPVNMSAIDEYQEVKERYDFLTAQQNDLEDAKAQLLNTMGELDKEVQDRFEEVFTATSAAFTEIFPQMFGGGHAELQLTDPENLLTTGIEIIAQPPGKNHTRLSLLSGGERALTAITLLFAIIKVRPVPFSVLDEVEASLDEANVDRFGDFLKHYSSNTQFIVITHRRGTMAAADILYGVTMQESGVSRMVSVSLDDAATVVSDGEPG